MAGSLPDLNESDRTDDRYVLGARAFQGEGSPTEVAGNEVATAAFDCGVPVVTMTDAFLIAPPSITEAVGDEAVAAPSAAGDVTGGAMGG